MNDKYTSNNIENHDLFLDSEEKDYENLIIRLQRMSKMISLLENKYLDKL